MKKKILSIALVVAMIAIIAAGSFAYFTDTKSADNVFTVGNVNIELTEPSWNTNGNESNDVYAGEALPKDPTVENTGANPCFVRVKVEGLDQFGANKMITYESGSNYTPNNLNDGWVLHTDGYFYWTKPLVVKGTETEGWNAGLVSKTAPLFDRVRMPDGLDGSEDAQPIVVTAEAVQAQGAMPSWSNSVGDQPAVKNMTVAQIAAWFKACGM